MSTHKAYLFLIILAAILICVVVGMTGCQTVAGIGRDISWSATAVEQRLDDYQAGRDSRAVSKWKQHQQRVK